MKKKEYLIIMITMGVLSLVAITINAFVYQFADWLLIMLGIFVAFLFVRFRSQSSMQYFSSKYNMLLDYDIEVEEALALARSYEKEAPTIVLKTMYQMYIGMALYYCGQYEEAIKEFNQINLQKIHNVYHTLIFSFTAYCAYELEDQETLDLSIKRLENLAEQVPGKYQGFVSNYVELLTSMRNAVSDPDKYKEMIDKHFSQDDGYLAKKLNYNYRLAKYYQIIGNEDEMDRCLAFCIANGKNHHTAIQAKKMFKGSVNVEDFIFSYDQVKQEEVVEDVKPLEVEEVVEQIEDESHTKE